MNDKQAPQPRKRMPSAVRAWLIFLAVIILMMVAADCLPHSPGKPGYLTQGIIALALSSILLGLWLFIRWVLDRRNLGRLFMGSAVLVTLIAIFYLEEDWRGKRAWDACKAELEAKGMVTDWDKYIPPSVPDDQNFFTASTNIALRFKKPQTDAEQQTASQNNWLLITYNNTNLFPTFDNRKSSPLLVAVVTVVPQAPTGLKGTSASTDLTAALDAPDTPQRVQDLLKKRVGRTAVGAAGFEFTEFQISNLVPAQVRLVSDTPHPAVDFETFAPANLISDLGQFQIKPGETKDTFQILLANVHATTAAEYLRWSDQFVPAFDEVREALKRPFAILPGDYSQPFMIPIPNFVTIRSMAQALAQRTQCHLLLNQPDQALADVTLIHDLCRILQRPPAGKPETLVDAMINVAVAGLYATTIGDGLRWHAWQQPQLVALQAQLESINLPLWVVNALHGELAASTRIFETTPDDVIADVIAGYGTVGRPPRSFWKRLQDPLYLYLKLAPQGWRYQNMVSMANIQPRPVDSFNLEEDTISPGTFTASVDSTEKLFSHQSPFTTLAVIAIPNYAKAAQRTAYNQTSVNETRLACALEWYHLKYGDYPETLGALVPDFAKNLPHDLIGGQPLHYRRTEDGKYLLYSVGWNEKDDGGVTAMSKNGVERIEDGDWVWKN